MFYPNIPKYYFNMKSVATLLIFYLFLKTGSSKCAVYFILGAYLNSALERDVPLTTFHKIHSRKDRFISCSKYTRNSFPITNEVSGFQS